MDFIGLCASREIPEVDESKWQETLSVQWDWFQHKDGYLGQLVNFKGDSTRLKAKILETCAEKLGEYEQYGYPFLELLTKESLAGKQILHVASGIYADLLPVVREYGFQYYLEDPLLDKVDNELSYFEMFDDEVRDFCSLPAERLLEKYAPEMFDIVICHNVLNHTCKPRIILDNIRTLLRRDGKLFLFHIDQPVEGSHPLRIVRKQLEHYLSRHGMKTVFESHFYDPFRLRRQHSYVALRGADAGPPGDRSSERA